MSSFTPTKREGLKKLKRGGTKHFWGSFTWKLEVLAILKGGGAQKFPLFKRGRRKTFYPVLRRGGRQ